MYKGKPQITPDEYLDHIKSAYQDKSDPEVAEGQMKYMRGKFEYYGLKAPVWTPILRDIFKERGLFDGDDLKEFVRLCFDDAYREIHYSGLQMIEKKIKKQPADFVDFLEECIQTESWWDSVDWINKLVGIHFKRYPNLQYIYSNKWIESDHFWLQRIAIIHQLTYKEKTDFELMKKMILRRADSKEFFIQKAAGWALRQYSKFNSEGVIVFVDENRDRLAPLTKREALRLLGRNK